jgi:replicative DNA helicase
MTDAADRLPPQDLNAEQATLGAMLMEHGAVVRARQIVTAKDFYREAHRRIFGAIETVDDAGDPVDVTTVAAVLRQREHLSAVGGAEYLTRVIGEVPTTAHVIRYASIVAEKARLRRLITLGQEIVAAAYADPEDMDALTASVQDRVRGWTAAGPRETRGTTHVADDGLHDELWRDLESPPGVSLARSGVGLLDKCTGGWAGHSVIVPMAGSGMGKSIFAQQCALASALQFRDNAPNTFVLCYILEAYKVWRRRAAGWLGRFNSQTFRRGAEGDAEVFRRFREAEQEIRGLPILVNDTLRDVGSIVTDARNVLDDRHQFSEVERIGLIIIDHAQRLRGPGDMVEKYEHIGTELEALANTLQAPIMLPSQVTVRDGQAQTKWARAIEENASLTFWLQRGEPNDDKAALNSRDYGTITCQKTREDNFGVLDYYVDIGEQPGGRADLRMYDEATWVAQGWRTAEQQRGRRQVDAERSAGYD